MKTVGRQGQLRPDDARSGSRGGGYKAVTRVLVSVDSTTVRRERPSDTPVRREVVIRIKMPGGLKPEVWHAPASFGGPFSLSFYGFRGSVSAYSRGLFCHANLANIKARPLEEFSSYVEATLTGLATIAVESPLAPDLAMLMARHTADMHAQTPPESIHMMDARQLAVPEVSFFVLRDCGQAIGMGAFKRLSGTHAEIKSMHILHEMRGRGLAKTMLTHLIGAAMQAGVTRLSLETGAEAIFAPARGLYERAGFTYCPPFEGYSLDPNSVFMTKVLA